MALLKVPLQRKGLLLVDEIVRGGPELPNMIPAMLKSEDALKENEMIPGGWNRQGEASNTQQLLVLLKALRRKI